MPEIPNNLIRYMSNDLSAMLRHYLDFEMILLKDEEILLPLYHNCTQDALMKFLTDGKIEADIVPCNVFNERLVYTFYGAAKFVKMETKPNASKGDATACIVLNSEKCVDVYRIYPIDTGVFSGKTPEFRPALMNWETIKDKLNLGNRLDRINKMALLCFENLHSYVKGEVSTQVVGKSNIQVIAKYTSPPVISHVEDTHHLMLDQSFADERRFCYEVQFHEEMTLVPDNVLQIIAYSGLLQGGHFEKLTGKYRVVLEDSLLYPSAVTTNYEIGQFIKDISKNYTMDYFKHKQQDLMNGKGTA